jgi:lipopolysaccharide transport system ATP-binding protein
MGAIEVTGLGKRYRAYGSPWARFRAAVWPGSAPATREFVALEGVTLSVPKGCALGVVGPNGAGKSTLLKILAGIVDPTEGSAAVEGGVASIIELGAGFHPEFTGQQNALLNAEILGFSPEQARAAYDDIARFCELGKYLDMPVKTYSSGMFVRLAFAVAISARPDVLLVDEALAVGDAVFAHRCLARIRAMRERGVTIVFVSHDTNTIAGVCDRAIYLDRGRVVHDGSPKDVIHAYLTNVAERLTAGTGEDGRVAAFHDVGAVETDAESAERRFGSFQARITDIAVEDGDGRACEKLVSGEPARFRMIVRFHTAAKDPVFGVMIRNRFGVEIFGTNTHLRRQATGTFAPGDTAEALFEAPLHLGAAPYTASFAVHTADGHFFDYRVDAKVFEVVGGLDTIGLAALPVRVTIRHAGRDAASPDDFRERLFAGAPSRIVPGHDAEPYLSGEWHAAEGEGGEPRRWLGADAQAIMRMPAGAGTIVLRLQTHAPASGGDPLRVAVSLDDQEAGICGPVTAEWGDFALPVPAELRGRVIAVRLRPSRTWSPADHNPASGDRRRLSVMLAEIRAE